MFIKEKYFDLPKIEENSGLAFCCEKGCGEINKEIKVKYLRFNRFEERNKYSDELLNAEYHYYPTCNKCASDLYLLDEDGKEIKFEYLENLTPDEENYKNKLINFWN